MGLDSGHSPGHPNRSASSDGARFLLVGANHRTCSLDTRERLLRQVSRVPIRTAKGRGPPWSDLVLLTTCNRVEVYALTETPQQASDAIHQFLGFSSEDERALYVLRDRDAAAHLLRVASGLDSLAEGETQVTEQVRKAPSQNRSRSSPRSPLANLFIQAANLAPRIRKIAGIRPGDTSASHAAVRFLESAVPLDNPIVALIGSGKMARIAAKSLRGRARLWILDRSFPRARELAKALGGKALSLGDLREVLAEADIVLAATAVQRPLLTAPTLRAAIGRRNGRPLWLVDLGFPRNVDPRSRDVAGVHLLDLDDLAPWGQRPPPPTAQARLEARIRKEADRLIESLSPSASVDVAFLRRTAESVRQQEVKEALARLPELSEEGRTVVDRLAMRLVNRFLHAPTQRLRSLPEGRRKEIIHEIVLGLRGGVR